MKKEKGFTILEVMIAAMLLAIGVVALVASLMTSYGTVSLSQDLSIAARAATVALEHLKGRKDYSQLYNDFYNYQEAYSSSLVGPFAVLADGSIDWVTDRVNPATISTRDIKVVGYGWFNFVTNETTYLTSEWGTSTAYNTTVSDGSNGGIDLDGNGFATNSSITVGRTEGSTGFGKYVILPVKVTIRIANRKGGPNEIEVIRRTWIINSYEKQ